MNRSEYRTGVPHRGWIFSCVDRIVSVTTTEREGLGLDPVASYHMPHDVRSLEEFASIFFSCRKLRRVV